LRLLELLVCCAALRFVVMDVMDVMDVMVVGWMVEMLTLVDPPIMQDTCPLGQCHNFGQHQTIGGRLHRGRL
jgi:hypothetical protein